MVYMISTENRVSFTCASFVFTINYDLQQQQQQQVNRDIQQYMRLIIIARAFIPITQLLVQLRQQ